MFLLGEWKRDRVEGIDEFLRAVGVGPVQRKIAASARRTRDLFGKRLRSSSRHTDRPACGARAVWLIPGRSAGPGIITSTRTRTRTHAQRTAHSAARGAGRLQALTSCEPEAT